MLAYTKKFNRIDSEKLIFNHHDENETHFFWENNKSNELIVGLGSFCEIEILNNSDLDSIKTKIEHQLNIITNLTPELSIKPKFFGGYAFDIQRKYKKNWGNFPRGYFILPKYMITSNHNNTFITLFINNTTYSFYIPFSYI